MSVSSKKCRFCANRNIHINYKNIPILGQFVDYFAKIKKRYYQGTCVQHQKQLSREIKKARIAGLLPFVR